MSGPQTQAGGVAGPVAPSSGPAPPAAQTARRSRSAPAAVAEAALQRLAVVLARSAGLVGPAERSGRREVLVAAVAERMAACAVADGDGYADLVERDPRERQLLVEAVLVGETSFWRNPPQMQALRSVVLPALVRVASLGQRRLVVWSAGCSTGEEAYTVAMMLAELVPHRVNWELRVVGSDLSNRALESARAGEFGARSVANLDEARRQRWLVPVGPQRWAVRDELRELVEFRSHNLVSDPPLFDAGQPADLILCRNVTIYFDRATTRQVIARLRSALAPDGLLMLGHSETLWKLAGGFTLSRVGEAFLYRRSDDEPVPQGRSVHRGPAAGPGVEIGAPGPAAAARRAGPRGTMTRVPRRRGYVPSAERGADQLLDEALGALSAGDYPRAALLAERGAELSPLLGRAHYLHGLALVSVGELERALPVLRRAVYADPGHGFAHFLLASVQSRLGDAAAAVASYRSAAQTLGTRAGDDTASELGGRSVVELAALCRSLAGDRPQL